METTELTGYALAAYLVFSCLALISTVGVFIYILRSVIDHEV